MASILVIHGPNLNLLGQREPGIYGVQTLEEINRSLQDAAARLQAQVDCFQSNHEGEIVDRIQTARGRYDGIIINAGALSHYSIALADALRSFDGTIIEVHLSNIYAREEYRRYSLISEVARGGVFGLGAIGYHLALQAVLDLLPARPGEKIE